MILRKIYFGQRRPQEAFETFRDLWIVKNLRRHFSEKYYSGAVSEFAEDSIFLIPIFGPGDEIRFASIYNAVIAALPNSRVVIGCEPRLLPLFSRSFPSAEMVAVHRKPRNGDRFLIEDYNRIRSLELRGMIDNNAVEMIDQTSRTVVVSDLLAEFRTGYDDFDRKAYLVADEAEVLRCEQLLQKARLRVGISWRSSLNTSSRKEHYLTVEELLPLFALEGIQFVNLQYDECSDEIAVAEQHYPGRLFDPDWLDQYNELDKVAALISSLDLVISPATTVVELAGALGAPTWLMSNSSELHWRKLEGADTDVWHGSLTHVEGAVLQNKASLVEALRCKLTAWRDEKLAPAQAAE